MTKQPVIEGRIPVPAEFMLTDAERQAERRAAHRRQAADDAIDRYNAAMAAGETELAVREREGER